MINKLKSYIDKNTAALIMSEENIAYFTSFHSSNGYLVVTSDKSFFLTDSRYVEAAQNKIKTCDEILLLKSMKTDLVNLIEKLGVNKIKLEADRTTVTRYNEIRDMFLSIETVCDTSLDKAINDIRITKTQYEVDCIIKAQRISEKAFEHILGFIDDSRTEKDISLELDYFMLKNGAAALSFETIAVSGKNSSLPHGVPSDKKIEKGDFITMDFGAVVDFYHSDMTRTVAFGGVSDKQIDVYNTVLDAQCKALDEIKAGKLCKDIDSVARNIIKSKGYGDYFGHGLGHGVGVEIHEKPSLNPSSEEILKPGHIVTVEPGIYLPGEFGVRIEDMVYITETGCNNLTLCDKKLIVL